MIAPKEQVGGFVVAVVGVEVEEVEYRFDGFSVG